MCFTGSTCLYSSRPFKIKSQVPAGSHWDDAASFWLTIWYDKTVSASAYRLATYQSGPIITRPLGTDEFARFCSGITKSIGSSQEESSASCHFNVRISIFTQEQRFSPGLMDKRRRRVSKKMEQLDSGSFIIILGSWFFMLRWSLIWNAEWIHILLNNLTDAKASTSSWGLLLFPIESMKIWPEISNITQEKLLFQESNISGYFKATKVHSILTNRNDNHDPKKRRLKRE